MWCVWVTVGVDKKLRTGRMQEITIPAGSAAVAILPLIVHQWMT